MLISFLAKAMVIPKMLAFVFGSSSSDQLAAIITTSTARCSSIVLVPPPPLPLQRLEWSRTKSCKFLTTISWSGVSFADIDTILLTASFTFSSDLYQDASLFSSNERSESTAVAVAIRNAWFLLLRDFFTFVGDRLGIGFFPSYLG